MPLLQLHENKVKKLGITSPSAKQLLISPTYEEHTFGKPDCTSKYTSSFNSTQQLHSRMKSN